MIERRPSDRTGVLAIRLWQHHRQLRARVRSTLNVELDEPTVTMCETEEAVLDEVHRWLRDFAALAERDEDDE
jgi:hypothetical protein